MSTTIPYQNWLQAVLNIAKHYRIEASEERIRLHLDWHGHQNTEQLIALMARHMGTRLRKVDFRPELINAWRLPIIVELAHDQVAVIEKVDAAGNVSAQFSGEQG